MGLNLKHYLHPHSAARDRTRPKILMKVLTPFFQTGWLEFALFMFHHHCILFATKGCTCLEARWRRSLICQWQFRETASTMTCSCIRTPGRQALVLLAATLSILTGDKNFEQNSWWKIDKTIYVNHYRHHPIGLHSPALQLYHQLGSQSIYRQFDIHRFLHLHSKWW